MLHIYQYSYSYTVLCALYTNRKEPAKKKKKGATSWYLHYVRISQEEDSLDAFDSTLDEDVLEVIPEFWHVIGLVQLEPHDLTQRNVAGQVHHGWLACAVQTHLASQAAQLE